MLRAFEAILFVFEGKHREFLTIFISFWAYGATVWNIWRLRCDRVFAGVISDYKQPLVKSTSHLSIVLHLLTLRLLSIPYLYQVRSNLQCITYTVIPYAYGLSRPYTDLAWHTFTVAAAVLICPPIFRRHYF